MSVNSVISPLENFKDQYHALKVELYHLCNALILFDSDCPIQTSDLSGFLTIENIMELCRICHQYFIELNYSIMISAQHILGKIVLTDDSPKDEVYMYFIAYLFTLLDSEPHRHMELYDLLMNVNKSYNSYIEGCDPRMIFQMIELEEAITNITLGKHS